MSWEVTDEHAASSYGQPVLVSRDDGAAYGPGDIVKCYPSWTYWPAWKAVERMAKRRKLSDEEQAFVERFINLGKAAAYDD
jgi:hypothetical protein